MQHNKFGPIQSTTHPHSPFFPTGQVDFDRLLQLEPHLRQFLVPTPDNVRHATTFDHTLPGATLALIQATFRHYFNLDWIGVPPKSLVPSVTRSVNYLLRLGDLLQTSHPAAATLTGLDVGTGASAVFPLLGCRMFPAWNFIGTDVSDESLEWARRNVESCGLGSRIVLSRAPDGAPTLLPHVAGTVDFVVCNPPFFHEFEEREDRPFQGRPGERAYDQGGEVGFVKALISDSVRAPRSRPVWFTSMVGHKASLRPLMDEIEATGEATALGSLQLEQGHRTRWVVVWAFAPLMPLDSLLPRLPKQRVRVDNLASGESLEARVQEALGGHSSVEGRGPVVRPVRGDGYEFELTGELLTEAGEVEIRARNHRGRASVAAAAKAVRQAGKDCVRTNRLWRRKRAREENSQ